jgi:hypothetical protein
MGKLRNVLVASMIHFGPLVPLHYSTLAQCWLTMSNQITKWGSLTCSTEIWNVKAEASIATIEGKYVGAYSRGNDLQLVATVERGNRTVLWNTSTWERIASMEAEEVLGGKSPTSGSFSPDGEMLIVIYPENVHVFEVTSATLRHQYKSSYAAISPDSRLFGSCEGQQIELRLAKTADMFQTLVSRVQTIYSLAFAPSSKLIASAGAVDVEIWNIKNWRNCLFLEESLPNRASVVLRRRSAPDHEPRHTVAAERAKKT